MSEVPKGDQHGLRRVRQGGSGGAWKEVKLESQQQPEMQALTGHGEEQEEVRV